MEAKSYVIAAIAGAIAVPLAQYAFTAVTTGTYTINVSGVYTGANIVAGAVAGVAVVAALHLMKSM